MDFSVSFTKVESEVGVILQNDKLNGKEINYYPSGAKSSEVEYVNDIIEGTKIYYN